jgi:hypothetical protein
MADGGVSSAPSHITSSEGVALRGTDCSGARNAEEAFTCLLKSTVLSVQKLWAGEFFSGPVIFSACKRLSL